MCAAVGAGGSPAELGPDAFWSGGEGYYLDITISLVARPQLAALVRGWLAAPDNPALQRAQEDMEREIMPWIDRVLATGQASGSVRTDLPSGLLIAVAVGMVRAMDPWLMTQTPDDALPQLSAATVAMLRRSLRP